MARMRSLDKVAVPGAFCGDGSQYYIYVDIKQDSPNLLVHFMGGGACWDYRTCGGSFNQGLAFLDQRSPMKRDALLNASPLINPFALDSVIYLPYCTGDVYTGTHVANYPKTDSNKIKVVNHFGYHNIEALIDMLQRGKLIDLESLEQFTLSGSSAGAIGAIAHSANFEEIIPKHAHKFLLADAPGLHWGDDFWLKFSPDMQADFSRAFARFGLKLDINNGKLVHDLPDILRYLADWRVGILQGSADFAMSRLFGNISMRKQHRSIYGRRGLINVAKKALNCDVFVPKTTAHTFFKRSRMSRKLFRYQRRNPYQFVQDLLKKK
jgi:hypothetical protein